MENSRGNLEDNFKSLESRDKLRKLYGYIYIYFIY